MTYLGRGDANKYNPQHANGKWVMRGSVYVYQSSAYSTWDIISAGLNWASVATARLNPPPVIPQTTWTVKYGTGIVGMGPPGGLVAAGPDVVGSRIRVMATLRPEWTAALTQQDQILACIGEQSEGIAGTTTHQPESQMLETTVTAVEGNPMTVQRQMVWNGSPLQLYVRHTNSQNITQNIHTDELQMTVEFI